MLETQTCPEPHEATPHIERLYTTYRRPIMAHLIRLIGDHEVAEELCQETFFKAWRAWEQHDQRASVVGWLYRIATNIAYDYLRRHRRYQFLPLLDSTADLQAPDRKVQQIDEGGPVWDALAQLPDLYRVPLLLHVCADHSTREIAAALGCSNTAVKTRLCRARERFRQVYRHC